MESLGGWFANRNFFEKNIDLGGIWYLMQCFKN